MKEQDIRIGGFYNVKVGSHTTVVRMMSLAKDGGEGWQAITLAGDKDMVIRSASRIVSAYNPNQDRDKAAAPKRAARAEKPTSAQVCEAFNKLPKRLSALDAAAKVLAEANGPLTCKQMLDAMVADGLWKPSQGGKTPANTLHAAIGTEIKKKGDAARFEKVGRGQFGLRSQ